MSRRIRDHVRCNVVGYVALFLVLTGGTAYALDGSNTVFSDDIVNGEVKTADIAGGAVTSPKVLNENLTGIDVASDSLTGDDVDESTLGQVPNSAQLGGKGLDQIENVGESAFNSSGCNPFSSASVTCVSKAIAVPAGSRVLVTAAGTWFGVDNTLGTDNNHSSAGTCVLAQSGLNNTDIAFGSTVRVGQLDNRHNLPTRGDGFALTAVTGAVLNNPVFKVKCTESDSDIVFEDMQISVVRLST